MKSLRMAIGTAASMLVLGLAPAALAAGGAPGGGGGGVVPVAGAATGADLQVSGSASSGGVLPGQPLDYTFQVKNSGPSDATAATLSDLLPSGLVFDGSSIPARPNLPCAATAAAAGTSVSCDLGTLPAGGQETVVIFTSAPATPGTFANTGTASSALPDPKPSNNSATVNVTVKPLPVCPVPAGQTSVTGFVQSDNFNAQGLLTSFVLQTSTGVRVVSTNFDPAAGPLTSLINALCKPVAFVFAGPGNTVTVTGTDGGTTPLFGYPDPVPVINASVVQSPLLFDIPAP